ncbi:MAG: FkbM family methyltransferase [Rhodobacteraceae bacterium]|nr:FkbM family methyltransferase [Paracoccaceae bacterium]
MRKYGEWAQLEIDRLSKFISSGDTVFDIGGYLGTHTRAFSEFVGPNGRVITFEASSESFDLLLANTTLGKYDNVLAINKAAGDKNETLFLGNREASNFGGAIVSSELQGPDAQLVESVRLDGQDLPDPSFIKIDVEGAEARVLYGARRLIARSKPVIFVEVNRLDGSVQVLEFAYENDYLCFGSIEPAYNPANFNGSDEDIYEGGAECGLILVPRSIAEHYKGAFSGLASVETADDLALLLMNKSQYSLGLLVDLPSASTLGVPFVELNQTIARQAEVIAHRGEEIRRQGEVIARRGEEIRRQGEVIAQKVSALRTALEEKYELKSELQTQSRRAVTLEGLISQAQILAKAAGKFPFSAYFKGREKYHRIIRTLLAPPSSAPAEKLTFSVDYSLVSENFDANYYQSKYSKLLANDEDLILHYMTIGCKLGFDPCPEFSTTYYLISNPKVAKLGIDPFLHYLKEGKLAGLNGREIGGFTTETGSTFNCN